MNASNLTRDAIELCEHFLACALVFAVQAVELRSAKEGRGYDATGQLSKATQAFYRAAREIAAGPPNAAEDKVANLLADISGDGQLVATIEETRRAISSYIAG